MLHWMNGNEMVMKCGTGWVQSGKAHDQRNIITIMMD